MRRKNLEKLIGTIITSLGFAFEVFLFKVYFNQHLSPFTFLSAFLLCFSGYTYLRFTENNRINAISFVAFAVFLLSIFFYIQSNEMKEILNKLIILSFALLIILIYHSSLYLRVLRGNIILKPLVISIVWLLLIYLYVNEFEWMFYFHQCLFIALLTIPFDIKTMNTDQFSTLPKVLGIHKTKKILAILIVFYALLSLLFLLPFSIISLVISVLLLISVLSEFTFKDLWLYIFYDGVIILQSLLVFLFIYNQYYLFSK